jgi:hypothetical protein
MGDPDVSHSSPATKLFVVLVAVVTVTVYVPASLGTTTNLAEAPATAEVDAPELAKTSSNQAEEPAKHDTTAPEIQAPSPVLANPTDADRGQPTLANGLPAPPPPSMT